ncbi:uncharacterized protein LOC110462368 [Mizuhopecten yessoensis]|nr:uncharacterized protein LOC110462368 [Mizuhopecten yessoensis]
MFTRLLCVLSVVALASALPMGGFEGHIGKGSTSDFFSKFIPKGVMANLTSNPMLQWLPGFISQTVNAARERKMMKERQQAMQSDVEMGGLSGYMARSSGGSTGLSLSSSGRQGTAMAADNPVGDYYAGHYGRIAEGMM